MSEKNIILKIQDLEVSYGYIAAVTGISLHVDEGQIVSLIGSNGAGKTSTLMAISGLVKKKAGTILFGNQDITKERADKIVRNGVIHVPEGRHVFPQLTVLENLKVGNLASGDKTKAAIDKKVEEQFALFPRLKERQKQMAGTLSGGEQQMLAMARGLMANPKLLMLDEPSMGLAPIIIDEIFDLILRLKEHGKTILLIEQNASLALSISDYAYVLELGKITMEGSGRSLLANEDIQKAYLGQ